MTLLCNCKPFISEADTFTFPLGHSSVVPLMDPPMLTCKALLPQVSCCLFEKFKPYFLDQLKMYHILPHQQFMSSAETDYLKIVRLIFLKDYLWMDG